MKFKVGDRVRILSKDFAHEIGYRVGDIGIVVRVPDNKVHYAYAVRGVKCENGDFNNGLAYYGSELELCIVRNTKIARKMYPNHKVIDKDWIERC